MQEKTRNVRLTLSYDGTGYRGWQRQPDQPSVQETIEQALMRIVGEPVKLIGSGRTDAGVHALGQVANFRSHTNIPAESLQKALNARLPADIRVLDAVDVPMDFHAMGTAKRKRYRYVFHDGPVIDVFRRKYAWHLRETLDAEAMHRAAQALVGRHDFSSYESAGAPRADSVRNVYELSVRRGTGDEREYVSLDIEADGFLYNMVRAIAGTLEEVGREARSESSPGEVLAACDRGLAGRTAPPHGLILLWVKYE